MKASSKPFQALRSGSTNGIGGLKITNRKTAFRGLKKVAFVAIRKGLSVQFCELLPETVFTPSSTIMYISTGNLKVTMRLEKDSGLEGPGARHKKIACWKS
jgi:hypothetical protein